MIEHVTIESDEDGFHLMVDTDGEFVVDDDLTSFNFRLGMGAAVQLLESVMEQIAPWHTEGQSVLRDFEHYQRTGERPAYLPPEPEPWSRGEHLAEARAVEQHQEEKHVAADETMRESGDLRKQRRENP